MGCCGGGSATNSMVYKVTWTDAAGAMRIDFTEDIGAYRILKASITGAGGAVNKAIQVPRAQFDEWKAQQSGGV